MKRESAELLGRLFARMVRELGPEGAESMVTMIAEEIGGVRLIFPDMKGVARMVRNRQIHNRFNGVNYGELGARYGLSTEQIRLIIKQQVHFRE